MFEEKPVFRDRFPRIEKVFDDGRGVRFKLYDFNGPIRHFPCHECGTPNACIIGTVYAHDAPCGAVCHIGSARADAPDDIKRRVAAGEVHHAADPGKPMSCPRCVPAP